MPSQVIWFASSYLGGKYTLYVFLPQCAFPVKALRHEPRSTSYVTLEISLEHESAYHAIREEETGVAQ